MVAPDFGCHLGPKLSSLRPIHHPLTGSADLKVNCIDLPGPCPEKENQVKADFRISGSQNREGEKVQMDRWGRVEELSSFGWNWIQVFAAGEDC